MLLEELNDTIANGAIDEFIRVSEARQVKALSKIADLVCERPGVRLVLLAGGSSAGKTTTAKRLATQIRVNGREALLLSTDDYFVGDRLNPRDENGELDYEHVEAVDIKRLVADIRALSEGRSIAPRRFDFVRHEGYDAPGELKLPPGGFVLLEGIHALNPRLTEGIEEGAKFRVYIEPRPTFEFKPGMRLTSRQDRLLRRLVRDSQFRKISPTETMRLWPKVIAGEERWILPFRDKADVTFDSYLPYELAALKPFVCTLIALALHTHGNDPDLLYMREVIMPVVPIGTEKIPGNSILRETIGGSQLDY